MFRKIYTRIARHPFQTGFAGALLLILSFIILNALWNQSCHPAPFFRTRILPDFRPCLKKETGEILEKTNKESKQNNLDQLKEDKIKDFLIDFEKNKYLNE